MKTESGFERYLTYINCEIQPPGSRERAGMERRFRAITISRQAGSGGHAVAEMVASRLQKKHPETTPPWTVFDRNLVERVLQDHNLPARLAQFMPEDRISEISDAMDELFGLHPASWELVRKVAETILHLAQQGNVVIIGRGANVITASLDTVLHLRLVGSEQKRVAHLMELESLSQRAALDKLRKEDKGRAHYMSKNFECNIDDPLLYHLVINTDLSGYDGAASIIVGLMELPAGKIAVSKGVAVL